MMIHFIRPFWLWTFVPVFCYLLWVIYSSRQHNPWRAICDPHLLPALLQQNRSKTRSLFHVVLFLFVTIAILALAGPSWKKTNLPVYRDLTSLMLVLDLSPAMTLTDLKPDRLSRAKFKIRDLINLSQNSEMGLVVFSGEAFVASPLSQDVKTLTALLDELHPQIMPTSGSDIGEGLSQALALLKQTTNPNNDWISGMSGGHSIVLITASEPTAKSWSAAKAIRAAGNQLHILAMLEPNSATQATMRALQQLAKIGGGSFYLFKPDATDIQHILRNSNTMQAVKDQNIQQADLWEDAGPWLCLLLVPLALLILREKVL